MRVEYNINKVQDMSYPLAQYGLLVVHSPVAPGLTGLGPEKKGEGACMGASHDGGEVAAGRCSGRGGAAWRARKKARGEWLGQRPAWGRRVGATRGRRWHLQSCSGGGRWRPATAEGEQRKKKRGGQGLM
jgi:hypothetical protein